MIVWQYDSESYEHIESTFDKVLTIRNPKLKDDCIRWFDIALDDKDSIDKLTEHVPLHHLTYEDIHNKIELPKFEAFDNYLFLKLKMLILDPVTKNIEFENVTLILTNTIVISIQEDLERDVFNELRLRIQHNIGRTRKRGADFLFHNLLDAIVDNYLIILELYREQLEDLELEALNLTTKNISNELLVFRKELYLIRRYITPLREEVAKIMKDTNDLIKPENLVYFQDTFDHLNIVASAFEGFREMLKDIMDLHIAALNQNTNDIMKTLTLLSAFFIPLTFIVGVYGMNFEYMPELKQKWGYAAVWGLMISLSLFLFWFMRRRKWL